MQPYRKSNRDTTVEYHLSGIQICSASLCKRSINRILVPLCFNDTNEINSDQNLVPVSPDFLYRCLQSKQNMNEPVGQLYIEH